VEDSPSDARLVRMALEEHGVEGELTLCTDGEKAFRLIDAVDALAVDCPDLFIIDLNVPKRNGREVIERMRSSAVCHAVPVVILSSSDDARDKEDGVRLGVNCYLRKPSRLEEFLSLGAAFRETLNRTS
jgi:chemotaxis family two-component system response regulator Rcp1